MKIQNCHLKTDRVQSDHLHHNFVEYNVDIQQRTRRMVNQVLVLLSIYMLIVQINVRDSVKDLCTVPTQPK